MLNSNIGYCHEHQHWTVVDTDNSLFVCGEMAVWDVPRGQYISVHQLESEMVPVRRQPVVVTEKVLS
jgi:hypothetical protein